MSCATAEAQYAVRSDVTDRQRIWTLSSRAAGRQVGFVPELGMVTCSMRHDGEELLGRLSGPPAAVSPGDRYRPRFTITVERQ
jgi:hypothetical protein